MTADFITSCLNPREVQELVRAYETIISAYDRHENWYVLTQQKKPAELFGAISSKKALWDRWHSMVEDGTLERYFSVVSNRVDFEKGGFTCPN